MRTLFAVCLSMSLALITKMSYAECKIIEHDGSTEVVCIGEPLTDVQNKEKGNSRRNIEQSSNKQQLEQERNQREEAQRQEKKDLERCSLDYAICMSGASIKDRGRCSEQQANCEKSIILNSPIQNSNTCKKICSLDYAICMSSASLDDRGRCSAQQANCEKLCL